MIPILCCECGKLLGHLVEPVNACRIGYYTSTIVKDNKIHLEKIDISAQTEPIGFILDAFGISNICCRKAFIGFVDFNKYL